MDRMSDIDDWYSLKLLISGMIPLMDITERITVRLMKRCDANFSPRKCLVLIYWTKA
jgi:hypothetical protein